MSDKLLLPGQTESQGVQELIVPGAAPEAPPAPPPPKGGPAPEMDPQQKEELEARIKASAENLRKFVERLKYPPQTMQATCPSCQGHVPAMVFPIQDYGANPELLDMYLQGQLSRASCPSCGAVLQVRTPLLVHWPEREFLGVVAPETGRSQESPQTQIGQLSSAFMARVPPAQRKGYMLTPKQFLSEDRLVDALWEFRGVTREMRRRRGEQMALIQRLLTHVAQGNGPDSWRTDIEVRPELVDREFVMQVGQMAAQMDKAEGEETPKLQPLLDYLLAETAGGRQVKAQQQAIQDIATRMGSGITDGDLSQLLAEQWTQSGGQEVVLAIVQTAPQKFGYEFLLELSLLIEVETEAARRKALEEMRSAIDGAIKQIEKHRAQVQQNVYQASVSLVSAALESEEPAALLSSRMSLLRGPFMPVLMNMIASARQNRAAEVVQQLLRLREIALQVQAETMSPEDCLLFQLITANSPDAAAVLAEENRALLTTDLLDRMGSLAKGLQENEMEAQAKKIRSLRGRIALMR